MLNKLNIYLNLFTYKGLLISLTINSETTSFMKYKGEKTMRQQPMRYKKMSKLAIVAMAAIVMMTGCSGSASNATTSNEGSTDQAVTLNFWAALDPSTTEGKTIEQQIKKFDQEHTDININLQVITYDVLHDKLVAAITAGDSPDLSWGLGEWVGEFNQMNALADLTPYMNEWKDKDIFYLNVMKALTIDEKVKALPNYLGIRALLYHENILKQAGYDAPPKTWDELLQMGPVIKAKTNKYAFGFAGTGVRASQELMTYLAQKGLSIAEKQADGKYKNTWQDNPQALQKVAEVFQFYKDMNAQQVVDPNAKTWGWEEEDQNFVLAQYAMVVNGAWIEGRTSENPEGMSDVKIAAPPYSDQPATFMEVAPLFVYNTEHTKQAWEFASFLMSKEYQQAVNPSKSARTDVESDKWGKEFMKLTSQGVSFPPVSLSGISQSMEDSIARLMLKNDSPEQIATWLSQAINENLQKTNQLSGS